MGLMIRNVYNKINLQNRLGAVKYPAAVYSTAQAALHACIRDLSYSQFNIEKVSVFEEPLYAYIEVSRPDIEVAPTPLFEKLKFSKKVKDKIVHLKLQVTPRREGQKNFKVEYEIMEPASVRFDGAGLLETAS